MVGFNELVDVLEDGGVLEWLIVFIGCNLVR